MNKKIGLLAGLIIGIFALNFVSASYGGGFYYDARNGMQQVIDSVVNFSQPLLQVLLGGNDWSGYLLFERFLLFVILISIVYVSLKNVQIFSENKGVLWIITIGVPLMGIRFIDFLWLNTIFMQYQILAIALTAGLPFVIYFLFLYKGLGGSEYSTLRKFAWVFFAVIYFGLWTTGTTQGYPDIYLYTAFLALIFFILDGTINRHFTRQRIDFGIQMNAVDKISEIDRQITSVNGSSAPADMRAARIKELMKDRRSWEKYLS